MSISLSQITDYNYIFLNSVNGRSDLFTVKVQHIKTKAEYINQTMPVKEYALIKSLQAIAKKVPLKEELKTLINCIDEYGDMKYEDGMESAEMDNAAL